MSRSARLAIFVSFFLTFGSQQTLAQGGPPGPYYPPETIYEIDWNERLAPNTGLKAHDANLLGDSIALHTGRLSFEHVDVSIPGNSHLPVEIRRRLNPSQSKNGEFHDWQLVTPTISTKILSNEWSKGQRWGKTRCSNTLVSAIPMSMYAQDHFYAPGAGTYPSQYSDGVVLDVPGQASGQVLDKTVSAGWPTAADKVTASNWYLTCIPNIDGSGTEGFYAHAPNGDTYRFDVIRERTNVAESDYWYISPSQIVWYHAEGTNYDILAVSEVTDVNGNWVRYEYNAWGRPSRIYSNDGREIQMPGSGLLIGSVIANPGTADERTWTYTYGSEAYNHYHPPSQVNGMPSTVWTTQSSLKTVTLPDGRSWQFDMGGIFAKPVPGDTYRTSYPNGPIVNCVQVDQTVTVTHPDGVTGEFEIEERRRFLPNAAMGQYGPPCPKSNIGRGANTVADVMAVVKKTLSAPGMPTAVWDYDYYDAGDITPNGQTGMNRTVITRPDSTVAYKHFMPGGNHTRMTKEEVYAGISSTVATQVVDYTYFQESKAGDDFVAGNTSDVSMPVRNEETTVTRGSDWYKTFNTYVTNRSSSSYSYGFPTQVDKWSSLGGGTRNFDITYLKDADDWILGLTDTVTRNGTLFEDYGYDTKGRLTSHQRFGVTVATLGYFTSGTQAGKLNWYQDALNRQTTFTNYYRGIPRTITRADSTTVTRVVDDNGWVESATNPRGYTTGYEYSAVGRLTKIDRVSPWTDTTIGYAYSGGNLIQTATRGTERTTTTYDAMLRPTRVRQQALSGGGGSIYTDTDYDAMGRTIFTSLPSTSAGSTVGIETDYDQLGRVTQTHETASGGGTTNYAYLAGNKTRVTDPVGNITTTTYSGFGDPEDGNAVKVEKPEGITVDYSFDIYGNLTTISQAKGGGATHDSSFVYDSRLRLCRRKVPETGDTLYAYNNANEMTSYAEGQTSGSSCATPPSSTRVSLTYDTVGRLKTTNYPSGTPDVTRTYDPNSNLLTINRGGANWTYAYNSADLPSSETLTIDSRTYAIGNTWDNNERLTQRVFPSGNTYVYTNDGLGRPTQIKKGGTSYVSSVSWHPNGKVQLLTRGNGGIFDQQLNARQLTSFIGSTYGDDLNYTYDANGRVTQINAVANNAWDRTLTYDGAGRLKTASGPWGSGTYLYDPLSNITKKTLGSRVVDIQYTSLNRVNRVRDTGVSSSWRNYSHDARGNVTADGIHTFTNDYANQPTVIGGADSGTYTYDGNLKRVKQVVGGETIYSVYDASGALLTRDNVTGGEETDYLSVAGQTFVRLTNGVASYPINDHLGTAFQVANQSGSIPASQTYIYTPFGEAYGSYSPGSDNEQGFTGHVEDETGLTYMQARYYDPIIGRFMQTDPIGYEDQLNLYAYVGNDPINLTDPTGKYGRGSGFTDKEWERFDAIQQQAAERMEKGAARLEKLGDKMDKKEADSGQKARDMAGQLRDGAEVLRSDGFDGHFANGLDQVTYEKEGGSENGAAFVRGNGPIVMVNLGNSAVFGRDASVPLGHVLGHEALHSVGLPEAYGPSGAKVYKYGFPAQRKAFKALTGTNEEAISPEHIMDWAY